MRKRAQFPSYWQSGHLNWRSLTPQTTLACACGLGTHLDTQPAWTAPRDFIFEQSQKSLWVKGSEEGQFFVLSSAAFDLWWTVIIMIIIALARYPCGLIRQLLKKFCKDVFAGPATMLEQMFLPCRALLWRKTSTYYAQPLLREIFGKIERVFTTKKENKCTQLIGF